MVKETQLLCVRNIRKSHPLFPTGVAPSHMESQLIGRVAAIEDDQIRAIRQSQNCRLKHAVRELGVGQIGNAASGVLNSVACRAAGMAQRRGMYGDARPWTEDFR